MKFRACLVVAVLALFCPYGGALAKDCPPVTLKCPTGEDFKFEVKYNSKSGKCEPQESVLDQAWSKCPKLYNDDSEDPAKKAVNDAINKEWKGRADGCSAPLGLDKSLNYHFQGACDLHDLCYASLWPSKDECDKWEHDNAKAICDWSDREKREGPDKVRDRHQSPCRQVADQVYMAMKALKEAADSFNKGQDWAKSRLCKK